MENFIAGVVLTAPSIKTEQELVELAQPFAQAIGSVTRGSTIELHWGYWHPTQELERSVWVWAQCQDDRQQLEVLSLVQPMLIQWGHENKQQAVALIETNKKLLVIDLVPV